MNTIKVNKLLKVIVSPLEHHTIFFLLFILFNFASSGMIHLLRCYSQILTKGIFSFNSFAPIGYYCFWGYLLCVLLDVVGKRWFTWILCSLSLSVLIVNGFINICFGMNISPTTIVLTAETNTREIRGFFDTFLFSRLAIVFYLRFLLILIVSVIAEKAIKHYRLFNYFIINVLVVVFLLSSMIMFFSCSFSYIDILKCKNMSEMDDVYIMKGGKRPHISFDPFTSILLSTHQLSVCSNEVDSVGLFNAKISREDATISLSQSDSLNIIVVIGESYERQHSALYGYDLPTTPFLSKLKQKGNLVVFSDAVAPANLTSMSLKNVFYTNSMGDGDNWSKSAFFPLLFSKVGYNVFYWDNQKELSNHSSASRAGFIDFTLTNMCYNKHFVDSVYTKMNDTLFQYDHELVENCFQKISDKTGAINLVMFHLYGQHFDAYGNYPHTSAFEYFTADSIKKQAPYLTRKKKESIAHYDNATRYNDYVLHKIITQYKNQNSVIVYFSDHGEHTYDYKDGIGRSHPQIADKNFLEYEYSVPLVVYCSDLFKKKYPSLFKSIEDSRDKPLMLDNISQMLFTLGHIKQNKFYRPERDVLSDKYHCPRRIVLPNFDYDKIVKGY